MAQSLAVTPSQVTKAGRKLLLVLFLVLSLPVPSTLWAQTKRDITVEDIISTTRLGDVDYFYGRSSKELVAHYSPDGARFVAILRKGDLRRNVNDYSLYLFAASAGAHPGAPRLLLRLSSSTNLPAIRDIKWLADNRTLLFLGTQNGDVPNVYSLDTQTSRLTQRTKHGTAVAHFDVTSDGRRILFIAETRQESALTEEQRRYGVLVEKQRLEDLYLGRFSYSPGEEQLFYQAGGPEQLIPLPATHKLETYSSVSFSPRGDYAVVSAYFRAPDPRWSLYNNHRLQLSTRVPETQGSATVVSQYFLFDGSRHTLTPLLDAPSLYTAQMNWSADGRAVLVKTFLPLEGQTGKELSERTNGELPAKISVPERELMRLTEEEWKQAVQFPDTPGQNALLQEDPNTPPKLYGHDAESGRKVLLLDLNPQFANLKFGSVEELRLVVHGVPLRAGLYLPPDYVPGRRYPLVVQTHGYDQSRFSMDGRYEWSSGFAARALAAAGIMVVQMDNFESQEDHDRVAQDRSLGSTPEQAYRNLSSTAYETAIEELDRRGMIDPTRVGITGFSRTVWFVAYTLTHSSTKFAAAVLTDGIDGGYFQYIAGRLGEFAADNGGEAPFGKSGLALWLRESPDFNLDQVRTPVRLVSIEDPASSWEWFVGLHLQQKPVEFVYIPGGTHLLERPGDRFIAMQGLVDWFRFWLQGYEDPDPAKAEEYARWQHLRALPASANDSHTSPPGGPSVK